MSVTGSWQGRAYIKAPVRTLGLNTFFVCFSLSSRHCYLLLPELELLCCISDQSLCAHRGYW